ncbi:hypothetical protein BDR04DRAFT_1096954 [Suillus decipiens]|nr:hypothetical protein BDR04DRAFT_1096954 [Suillus decipiens]
MIQFHAFHLPMPQYQPPVEPLIWIVNPSSLVIDEKILHELRMTVMDLMLHSISNKATMLPWREGFSRSKTLVRFLNVLDAEQQANEQIRVIIRIMAIEIVTDGVDADMRLHIFGMLSKDVTPELLSFDLDALLTARLQETTLWL